MQASGGIVEVLSKLLSIVLQVTVVRDGREMQVKMRVGSMNARSKL